MLNHDIIIIIDNLECARIIAINLGLNELAKAIENLSSKAADLHNALIAETIDESKIEYAHELLDNVQGLAVAMCENENNMIVNQLSNVMTYSENIQEIL